MREILRRILSPNAAHHVCLAKAMTNLVQLWPKNVQRRFHLSVLLMVDMNAIMEHKNETITTLAEAIAAHRFAAGMKPEYLKRLTDAAMFKQFEADEIVFREGEPANRFYLIRTGKIALESKSYGDSAPLVQIVGEDEVLGWSWLFPPYYWHFGARAVEPTDVIFFYGTRLRAQCEEEPAFGYELMKRMATIVIKRLQITRVQLLQLQQESSRRDSPE
jgi:CRP/FNR family transcriptional regulator, cyclic AMP receptor protein